MNRRSTRAGRATIGAPPGSPRQERARTVGWPVLSLLAALAWVTAGLTSSACAASAPPSPLENELEAEYAHAPVVLDGEPLFYVRGVMAYPAERRAQVIAGRIQAVAADRSVPLDALRVVETEHGADILAGNQFLTTVTEADTQREGVTPRFMAEPVRARIASAIAAYRNERAPRALFIKTTYSLGATLVFGLLLVGTRRAFRSLHKLAELRLKTRIEGLEMHAFHLVHGKQLLAALHSFITALQFLWLVGIAYVYLRVVLELFPWTRSLARHLDAIFLDPLGSMASAFLDAVPNLIFIALLVLVIRYLLKLVRLLFAGVASGTVELRNFDPEWAWPTYRAVRFIALAFAVIVAYPHIPGSTSPAFQGVSIFIGIIFSLGSSSFIANLIAGYSMTYRRAFRIGDRIQVGDIIGDVTDSGLMVTRLRTVKNEEVVVPNSKILESHIVNYSTLAQKGGLILHTTVGIGYETPWRQVEAMLLIAAGRTPGVLREPPPFVLQKTLGDFCITYEINAHSNDPQAMSRLYAELHRNILDVFNEYDVQIMTPAYEVDPEQPKTVPKARWYLSPAPPLASPANCELPPAKPVA